MTANNSLKKRVGLLLKLLLVAVTLALALFLGGLGNKLLDDLSHWYQEPQYSAFEPAQEMKPLQAELESLEIKNQRLEENRRQLEQSLAVANRKLESEQQSYRDWLSARQTIGSPQEDPEIRARLGQLDKLRQVAEQWRLQLDGVEGERVRLEREQEAVQAKLSALRQRQEESFRAALQLYELKIFLIRLAVVGPLLLLAVYLFFRKRSSPFWPLVWGYIIFALLLFFVGLVPYLPSYGGYVRYSVGVVLTLLVGWYLVRTSLQLAEKWKKELSQSMLERARRIGKENSWKAHRLHRCPACEKDFLFNKWRPPVKISQAVSEEEAPDFCPYCGLRLYDRCSACGTRYFIHFSFCPACGAPSPTVSTAEPSPTSERQ